MEATRRESWEEKLRGALIVTVHVGRHRYAMFFCSVRAIARGSTVDTCAVRWACGAWLCLSLRYGYCTVYILGLLSRLLLLLLLLGPSVRCLVPPIYLYEGRVASAPCRLSCGDGGRAWSNA